MRTCSSLHSYAYPYNLQGDVIGLVDGNGTKMVSYTYDAWGKMISKTGTLATTLGTLQPFRYRGYIFDEETGLYYLRSRYYNPNLCRFINADDGEAYVDAIATEQCAEPVKAYNFEVEDFHTYFIARHSVLVHNMCKVPDRSGKQARLKELMNDDKLPRHIRGELKRDFNAIQRGTRRTFESHRDMICLIA